jgi:hypothetical protein
MSNKESLVKELMEMGVEVPKGFSVIELRTLLQRAKAQRNPEQDQTSEFGRMKKDMMSSLSNLRRELLVRILSFLGETVYKKMTKGDILLEIRSLETKLDSKVLTIGKHKGATFWNVMTENPSYSQWAMSEMNKTESSPQLKELGTYLRLHYTKGFKDWMEEIQEESEEEVFKPKERAKFEKVKKEEPEEKPQPKGSSGSQQVPVPDSDLEEEEDDAEDPKKKKKVSIRPVRRPETFTMESDSSATSWMELADKRKHPGRTVRK